MSSELYILIGVNPHPAPYIATFPLIGEGLDKNIYLQI